MSRMTNAQALAQIGRIFEQQGLRPALAFFNGLTPHRFTSLYRFDKETLRNLYFYDRENPAMESCADIPVMASYCVFVRDSVAPFATASALDDERVRGHPKQRDVQSYCGVPLLDRDDRMFGTICHYDFKPVPIDASDVLLLESVASYLQFRLAGMSVQDAT